MRFPPSESLYEENDSDSETDEEEDYEDVYEEDYDDDDGIDLTHGPREPEEMYSIEDFVYDKYLENPIEPALEADDPIMIEVNEGF